MFTLHVILLLAIRLVVQVECMRDLKNAYRSLVRKLLWKKSLDSSVGIALGYGLHDRGSRVRFPEEAGNFSLHHRVQTDSGSHPDSYPMGTKASSLGVKRVPRSKDEWSYTSTPPYVFMAWCLVKRRDKFTFTFTFKLLWKRPFGRPGAVWGIILKLML
jgi:hypothetical protein